MLALRLGLVNIRAPWGMTPPRAELDPTRCDSLERIVTISNFRLFVGGAIAAALLVGCQDKKETAAAPAPAKPAPAPAPAPTPAAPTAEVKTAATPDLAAAKEIFNTRCFACHGMEGKGDGPGAAGLDPKPRNYSDKAWQASVTDEQIEKIIKLGGVAVGKSPAMPPNPDLEDKPQVIAGLRAMVRGFAEAAK